MKSIREANIINGTKVFVASDIDVPIDRGQILETFRLEIIIPTLKYIINRGGIPTIAGHIGQPRGKYDETKSTKHLKPFFDKALGSDKYVLLENLRFDPREEQNDLEYAQEFSSQHDLYVNENFSTSHRENTSIVGIPKYLTAYAGLRFEEEVTTIKSVMSNPVRPLVAIIGGAKLESKKPVVLKFLQEADFVLVGGLIGLEWTDSIPNKLLLPTDYVDGNKDLGLNTIAKYIEIIKKARTVIWAGPTGMYENPRYIKSTEQLALEMILNNVYSVIGGGDTISAFRKLGFLEKVSFVSSGGGAMLQLITDGTLPGITALG